METKFRKFYVTKHGAEENAEWMRPTVEAALARAKELVAADGETRAVVVVRYIVKREHPIVVVAVK